jgi:hypothetical protein
VSAIVEKYMADHPEKWDVDMAALALDAVQKVCIQ